MKSHWFVCQYCHKKFWGKNLNRKFCCSECAMQSRKHLVTYKCQMCGKTFTRKYKQGGHKFCSNACYHKKPKVKPEKHSIFTCKWCGKKFETWTYRHPTMCSRQCASEYGAHQLKPHKKPSPTYAQVIWQCKQCGKTMQTFKSRVKDTCSRKCARLYFGASEKVEYTCPQCGKIKLVPKCNVEAGRIKFCGKVCAGIAHSLSTRGENNPRWRGGCDSYRGPNWVKQSRLARARDQAICQKCNGPAKDVHHIRPYRTFKGNWEKANQLSNLITLCSKCHSKIEHGHWPCPKPKALPVLP